MLAHQQNINDYMTKPIAKANSFLYFELKDASGNELLATNFLLLERFKYSTSIVDPNLKVCIFKLPYFASVNLIFILRAILLLFFSYPKIVFDQR